MRDYRQLRKLPVCKSTGKLSHPDFHSAARHMKKLSKNGEILNALRCYPCHGCGGYHVGHVGRGD